MVELKLYFETELGKLYLNDTWHILKYFKPKMFDLIILDPPYLITRDSRVAKWDVNKNWYYIMRMSSYLLKDNGYVFLFGLPSFYLKIANCIRKYFRIFFDLIWIKPSTLNFLNAKIRPLNRHEQILCLIKNNIKFKDFTYNYKEIGWYGDPYVKKNREKYNKYINAELRDNINIDGFRFPTTVLFYPNKPCMPFEERTIHPTQKPLGLIEYIVKGWSNPNDYVFDPFIGSGTTAVVCEKINRRWIGIEIEEKYCSITVERLKKIINEKKMQLTNWIK